MNNTSASLIRGYYFISDNRLSKQGIMADVATAIQAGVRVVQYRNKEGTAARQYEDALQLRRLCQGVLLVINDRVDIALAVDADGVHLGQQDMPAAAARKLCGDKKIIGVSVRNLEQAQAAQDAGADYIGVGPVFTTHTKQDAGDALGIETFSHIRKIVRIPVVAIGGITRANAAAVIDAGADAVCALSDVFSAADLARAIGELQSLFSETCGDLKHYED